MGVFLKSPTASAVFLWIIEIENSKIIPRVVDRRECEKRRYIYERTSRSTDGLSSSRVNSVAENQCRIQSSICLKKIIYEEGRGSIGDMDLPGRARRRRRAEPRLAEENGDCCLGWFGDEETEGEKKAVAARIAVAIAASALPPSRSPRVIRATTTAKEEDIWASGAGMDGARPTDSWAPRSSDPTWPPNPSIKSEPDWSSPSQARVTSSFFLRSAAAAARAI
jgi:hypothetical protein